MSEKTKSLISLNTEIRNKGVKKAIKKYGNNRSFSKYIETLIIKDNE